MRLWGSRFSRVWLKVFGGLVIATLLLGCGDDLPVEGAFAEQALVKTCSPQIIATANAIYDQARRYNASHDRHLANITRQECQRAFALLEGSSCRADDAYVQQPVWISPDSLRALCHQADAVL